MSFAQLVHAAPAVEASTLVRLYLEGFDPVEHADARLPFRLLTQPRLALGLMLYLEGFDPVEHADARLPFRLLTQPRLALGLMLHLEGFDPVEHADARLPGGLGRRLLLADTGLARRFLGGKPVAVAHMVHAAAAIEA